MVTAFSSLRGCMYTYEEIVDMEIGIPKIEVENYLTGKSSSPCGSKTPFAGSQRWGTKMGT